MNHTPCCWCGNADLVPFSPAYLKCPACETLVTAQMPESSFAQVTDDERDFYGREYWFSHQEKDLGFPNIKIRARTDLVERCLHWVRAVLKYKLPPGQVLELGSGHGGFVALLHWAGFDATGLELSSWVVQFARETFGMPMLLGPVEDQQIKPASLDMIVLMDVLEHLPDPVSTMRHCLEMLKPNGILVIQTPCLPEGRSYEDLVAQSDPFLELLKEKEHLYLFSQRSIREFFGRLEVDYFAFEPAIFAHYDMFLVVSQSPMAINLPAEIDRALGATPGGRTIQALLDLDNQIRELTNRHAKSEADRAARLVVIEDQAKVIEDQAKVIASLQARCAGRVYRLMCRLGRWGWLEQVISHLELDRHNRQSQTDRLHSASLPLASPDNVSNTEELNHRGTASNSATQLTRIVVDLTPLLPGGENGGAKLMAMGLVRQLSQLLPHCEFVLFTSGKSHDELAILDSPNVSRLCVSPQERAHDTVSPALRQISIALHEKLALFLPASVFTGLKSAYRSVRHRQRQKGRLKEMGADLLFCPFTAPFFYDPSVPTVSVIYDLQYLDYPQFFSVDERHSRDRSFKEACRLADRLVCISEYVRGTVLANSDIGSDRVAAIHPRLFNRLQRQEPQNTIEALKRRSLLEQNFLLYPANSWPHKNHRMLFTAFGMYRARHPESELKLVCTGAPDKRTEDLREAAQRMGLEEWIVLAGYLSDEEFAALSQSCLAVIFPSLYEGFGMPLLEAMAFGKPVLCSNVTSLPEVAGDATLYFDPRRPQEIVSAIERIATDPELVAHLMECGYRRLATFGGSEQMAQQYLHVFRELMAKPRSFAEALQGVYPDGWTGERVVVTYSADSGLRHLEMLLQAPPWLPHDHVSVTVLTDGSGPPAVHAIARGQSAIVRQVLPNNSGYVECVIEPTFQRKTLGLNDDERVLGCLCQTCQIISEGATHDLLAGRG